MAASHAHADEQRSAHHSGRTCSSRRLGSQSHVFDIDNGRILFQTRMPTSIQGFPMTYAVRGKQYLAIPVGTGGGSWTSQVPVQLTPERRRPTNANAIYVFALPGT